MTGRSARPVRGGRGLLVGAEKQSVQEQIDLPRLDESGQTAQAARLSILGRSRVVSEWTGEDMLTRMKSISPHEALWITRTRRINLDIKRGTQND